MNAKKNANNKLKQWEYPEGSRIKIGEIINSRGKDYYGVSYRVAVPAKLTGKERIFKQFKDKEEAFTWAEEQWNGYNKQGASFFKLTDKQQQEAAWAWEKAIEHGLTLMEIVDYALPLMRPQGGKNSVNAVFEEMLNTKLERQKRGTLKPASVKNFKVRVGKFSFCYGERMIQTIRAEEIKQWLLDLELSQQSIKNYKTSLGELFKYATQKKYLSSNPLDSLSDEENRLLSARARTSEPEILSVAEAKKLLKTAAKTQDELELLPAIIMALFCGVRTEEIKRMDWKEVHFDKETPMVNIPNTKAKKRKIRNIDIPSNALRLLLPFKKSKGQVVPHRNDKHFERKFELLLHADGWIVEDDGGKKRSQWRKNCMRHSFGSYHYALHGDSMKTARLLGHSISDQVLFDHYRALASKADAKKYFAIRL